MLNMPMRWITLLSPTLLSSTYKWKWRLREAKTRVTEPVNRRAS